MLSLYAMRHGQTTHLDHLRGSTDDELTKLGLTQMQLAWDKFPHKDDIQAIISSDLKRCANFAWALSDELDLPMLLMPQLQELHFGDWEGQKVAELYEKYPDDLVKFWQTPSQFTPPNAESLSEFAKRVDNAIIKIKHFAKSHHLTHVLIITHGGVIKYLMTKINHMPLDDLLKNSAEHGKIYTFDGDKLP